MINAGDTAWVLTCTGLVMLMTPGLAFFYGGMVRRKNILGILMQCFIVLCILTLQWVLFGYSLSFSPGSKFIGSLSWFGLHGVGEAPYAAYAQGIPHEAFMIFQAMFAIITPALIIGAFAERMKFSAFLMFMVLWATFVYDPVCHWIWGVGGWLKELGVLDFAGGAVVHINAGIAALAVVLVVGRRRGWPGDAMPPHSLPLTVLGTGILWFGWFGFNAGSALGANGLAAQAFVNTNVAAASAMLGWLVVERIKDRHPTTLGAASGAVAGLVAITPCAGYVNAMAAIAVGLLAGAVCFLAISLKYRFGYDDALDVVGVHLVGGIIGSLCVGVFATRAVNPAGADGIIAGGGWHLLLMQLLAVGVTLALSFVVSLGLAKAVDAVIGLRVTPDAELEGLDATQHAETAYNYREVGSMGRIG